MLFKRTLKTLLEKINDSFQAVARDMNELREGQAVLSEKIDKVARLEDELEKHRDVLDAVCDHLKVDVDFAPRLVRRDGEPTGGMGFGAGRNGRTE